MATSPESSGRHELLLQRVGRMTASGVAFEPLAHLDEAVDSGTCCTFLRLDVHDVNLDALLGLLGRLGDAGIRATVFFLDPGHSRAKGSYTFGDLVRCIRRLQELNHEAGLHLDPWSLTEGFRVPLRVVLEDLVDRYRNAGVEFTAANLHGNSRSPLKDHSGFGAAFDLFEEIARQPDHPQLASLDQELAATIREHRVSARQLGFVHWGDMPLWSARHGYVVTHFVTDNQLGKTGTIEVFVQDPAESAYRLADRQPPGSRTPAAIRRIVPCGPRTSIGIEPGSHRIPFETEEVDSMLSRLSSAPTLMLIHPEFFL